MRNDLHHTTQMEREGYSDSIQVKIQTELVKVIKEIQNAYH